MGDGYVVTGMAGNWTEFVRGVTCGHAVQLYADPAELAESVAAFLGAGFAAGDPGLLVTTPENRTLFVEALAAAGWDAAQLDDEGLLVTVDAETTLHAVLGADGFPSAAGFDAVVGTLLDELALRFPGRHVRAFGEMVDLLAADGKPEAVVSLEELWNSLTRSRPFFSLLCGYKVDVFDRVAQAGLLPDVCRTHTHVLPAPDSTRLARAVDGALEEILGSEEAGKVYVVVGREIREARVPAPQLILMWVSEHIPVLADRILAAARRRYAAAAAPAHGA